MAEILEHAALPRSTSDILRRASRARTASFRKSSKKKSLVDEDEEGASSPSTNPQNRMLSALFGGTPMPEPDVWPSTPLEKAKIFNNTTVVEFGLSRHLFSGEKEPFNGDPDRISDCIRKSLVCFRSSSFHIVRALKRFFKAIRVIHKYAKLRQRKKVIIQDEFVAMWEEKEEELREEYQQHMEQANYRIHHSVQDSIEEFAKTCTPSAVKRKVVDVIWHRHRMHSAKQHKVWLIKFLIAVNKLNDLKDYYAGDAAQLMTMAHRDKMKELRKKVTEILLMKPVVRFGIHTTSIKQLLAVARELYEADKKARGKDFLTEWEAEREAQQEERRKQFEKIALRREMEYRSKKREDLKEDKLRRAQEKLRVAKILDRRFHRKNNPLGEEDQSAEPNSPREVNSSGEFPRGSSVLQSWEESDGLDGSVSFRSGRQSPSQGWASPSPGMGSSQRRHSKLLINAHGTSPAAVVAGAGHRRAELMSKKDGAGHLFKKTAQAIAASRARNSVDLLNLGSSSNFGRQQTSLLGTSGSLTNIQESIASVGKHGGGAVALLEPAVPDDSAPLEIWQQYYADIEHFKQVQKREEEERVLVEKRAKALAAVPTPELKPFHAVKNNKATVHQPGNAFIRIVSTDQEERERFIEQIEKPRPGSRTGAHHLQRTVATPNLIPKVKPQNYKQAMSSLSQMKAQGPDLPLEETQINIFTESTALSVKQVGSIRKRPDPKATIPPYKEVPRPDSVTLLVKIEKPEPGHVSRRAERLYKERKEVDKRQELDSTLNSTGVNDSIERTMIGSAPASFSTIRPAKNRPGTAGLVPSSSGELDEAALPVHHSSVHPSFLSHNMKIKAHRAFSAMMQQGADGYKNRM